MIRFKSVGADIRFDSGRRRALDARMDLALKNPTKRRTKKGEVVSSNVFMSLHLLLYA